VRRFERVDDLPRDGDGLVDGQRAAFQRLALDQLHDDRSEIAGVFDAVHRGNVGMIQRRQQFRLALKAGDAIGIAAHRLGQDFDRDVALQLRIARAIHLAHAAGADRVEDLERAKPRARREAHCAGCRF
jgi:hypothetical protein